MKKLFFMAALLLTGITGFSQNTGDRLRHYILIKNALISSDREAADKAAAQLHLSVSNEPDFEQKAALLAATQKLDKANSLDKQRAAFGDVSVILWVLVKKSEQVNRD